MDVHETKQMLEEEAQPRETLIIDESNHESDNKSEDDLMGSENSFDQAAGAAGTYMERLTSSSADDLSETSEKAPSVYSSEAHDENNLDEENSVSSDCSDNRFCSTVEAPAMFTEFDAIPSFDDDINNLQFTEEEYQELLSLAEPF